LADYEREFLRGVVLSLIMRRRRQSMGRSWCLLAGRQQPLGS
jgi:hypothetical protein